MNNEIHLVTDFKTLKVRDRGPAIAGIWLASGDTQFPIKGWSDFVVVVLGWWAVAIVRLMRSDSDKELVNFMDGPYSVELTRAQLGEIRLRMLAGAGGGREVAVGEADLQKFVTELTDHARDLLELCKLRQWWSADAETLESNLRDLDSEMAARRRGASIAG